MPLPNHNAYTEKSNEELDELVIDAKCEEASSINNQGRDAQIAYLMKP